MGNYKFDLVAKGKRTLMKCLGHRSLEHGDSCHVEVYEGLQQQRQLEINWDKTTCPRKNQHQDNNGEGNDYFTPDIMKTLCQTLINPALNPICQIFGGGGNPAQPATQQPNQAGPQPPVTGPTPKPKSVQDYENPSDGDIQGSDYHWRTICQTVVNPALKPLCGILPNDYSQDFDFNEDYGSPPVNPGYPGGNI